MKIVAKKKKTVNLMSKKPNNLLTKLSKEHIIRFAYNHNHVILKNQKSVLLLN